MSAQSIYPAVLAMNPVRRATLTKRREPRACPAAPLRPLHALLVGLLFAGAAGQAAAQVAVKARTVYTMTGEPIKDGVVVVVDGKISAVGPAATTQVPEGMRVLEAAVVTPGLIDAHCTVGVGGMLNQRQDQDQLERSAPIQPELRAIDAYNPLDPLVEYVRSYGITCVHTGHAPGEAVSGQTAVFKTRGDSVEEAVLLPLAAIAATLSDDALKDGGKSPGTRAKVVALLREQLIKAREYMAKQERAAAPAPAAAEGEKKDEKKDPPARDLRLETLAKVLRRELPLMVTADRARDIQSVLRLAKEFDIRVILDSGSESYLLLEEVKAAGVDVIVHPSMARALGALENKSFETATTLHAAGVRVALQGGYESYVPKARVVLFEAAVAAANGLGPEAALRACTADAAEMLGIADRVGSIRVGLDGDLALYDGDPFEYTTRCVGVVIDGTVVVEKGR